MQAQYVNRENKQIKKGKSAINIVIICQNVHGFGGFICVDERPNNDQGTQDAEKQETADAEEIRENKRAC